jgi:hypothetical protein
VRAGCVSTRTGELRGRRSPWLAERVSAREWVSCADAARVSGRAPRARERVAGGASGCERSELLACARDWRE